MNHLELINKRRELYRHKFLLANSQPVSLKKLKREISALHNQLHPKN